MLTPASVATSSRRSPGVRRRPESGSPTSAGCSAARGGPAGRLAERRMRRSRRSLATIMPRDERDRLALPSTRIDPVFLVAPRRAARWTHDHHRITHPPLAPGRWALDTNHSSVGFTIRHLGVSKVRGRFQPLRRRRRRRRRRWTSTSSTATIDLASIDTGNPDRDAHVRSPDLLDVERRPTMTFRSTAIVGRRRRLDRRRRADDRRRHPAVSGSTSSSAASRTFPRRPAPRRVRGDGRAAAQGLRHRHRHAAGRERRRPRRRRQDRARHPAARARHRRRRLTRARRASPGWPAWRPAVRMGGDVRISSSCSPSPVGSPWSPDPGRASGGASPSAWPRPAPTSSTAARRRGDLDETVGAIEAAGRRARRRGRRTSPAGPARALGDHRRRGAWAPRYLGQQRRWIGRQGVAPARRVRLRAPGATSWS